MFELRKLPYEPKDFKDFLSEESFAYHYGKHHKAYIDNLNKLIKDSEFEAKDLIYIIKNSNKAVFNNAAQVYNHDFYFDCIKAEPNDYLELSKELKSELEKEFKSLEAFKELFIKEAMLVFGSGWFWLVFDPKSKKLELLATFNACTPVSEDKIPLLVVDVWEHAYYVDHRNARAKYLEGFFEHINWAFVSKAYDLAIKDGLDSLRLYATSLHPL